MLLLKEVSLRKHERENNIPPIWQKFQMLAYWKKYEKVEKEHRKRAEKEAMEQRKMDDELREVRK